MSNTLRLIMVPAALSLAVTLLRLTGELLGWSERWFSKATGGIVPSGVSWVVGITWLPIPFGVYFALKLISSGQGPKSVGRAVGLALAGAVLVALGRFLWRPPIGFPAVLLYIWLVMAVAAGIQMWGWPQLTRVLAAYGLAARIPVAVVMFLAMWGEWGTHYDYVGMPAQFQMPFWPRFLWLAFVPQLVFWVAFSVLLGSLAGSVTAAATGQRRKP